LTLDSCPPRAKAGHNTMSSTRRPHLAASSSTSPPPPPAPPPGAPHTTRAQRPFCPPRAYDPDRLPLERSHGETAPWDHRAPSLCPTPPSPHAAHCAHSLSQRSLTGSPASSPTVSPIASPATALTACTPAAVDSPGPRAPPRADGPDRGR
jgi:hypothetical protein